MKNNGSVIKIKKYSPGKFIHWPASKIYPINPLIRNTVLEAFQTWENNGINYISKELNLTRHLVDTIIDQRYSR